MLRTAAIAQETRKMATLVMDGTLEKRLREDRKASGADRYDEVWEGVYMMTPMPNNEHQELVGQLYAIFQSIVGGNGKVYPGANVSDRDENWEQNYRVPDVAVFLSGTTARDCGTHWQGGPDFAVEIMSPYDRSREKFTFYAQVGVRELLLVDRSPWNLELYRLQAGQLSIIGQSNLARSDVLASEVLPLHFRLIPGSRRPMIEILKDQSSDRWLV